MNGVDEAGVKGVDEKKMEWIKNGEQVKMID